MINRKTILIISAIVGVLVVGIGSTITITSSYNEYMEGYNAIMQERENRKFENIEGVIVKDVSLANMNNKPSYVISGTYEDGVDPNSISFKLNTYEDRANFAEIVHKEIDEEKKIFRMYTDITYLSADGDGNTEYNIDGTASSVNPDNPQIHSYYPKLVIGDKEVNMINTNALWNDRTLQYNDCTYKIVHNNNKGTYPFAMPAVVKTTTAEIPSDATYAATGVDFVKYGTDVYYVLHGTSSGYTRDTLSKVLSFEMRVSKNSSPIYAIRGTQGGHLIMENNGDFKLYVRLNNVPDCGTNAYYTRFGKFDESINCLPDLKVPGINGIVDQTRIVEGNREYIIYIAHGSGAASAYNTTGVYIRTLNS